jgi:hypothetical protein
MSAAQIHQILTASQPSKLVAYLKTQSAESLATVHDQDPLDQLNPAVHSLGYLFIL